MKNIVILGAGIGGKLAASGIVSKFPDCNVILIGPESKTPGGLFYFNEEVPGIAERPIKVSYQHLDDMNEDSLKEYQVKSRGVYDESFNVSSFSKIGRDEVGYLLNDEIPLDKVIWIKENVEEINLHEHILCTKNSKIGFDYMVSTIPCNVLVKLIYGSDITNYLKYQPVYLKEVVVPHEDTEEIDEITVHYDLTNSTYYRHSSYKHKGNIISMSSESIKEFSGYTRKLIPGKIIPGSELPVQYSAESLEKLFPWLRILGRYARWEYHYLVTDTYRDATEFIGRFYKEES